MGSSVTQKEVSPDFWNHDSVKSNLPTILPYTFLFHLLNPSSISYSRRYYPSHLSYPTFPSSYQDDEVYPKPSAARGVQSQPAAASGVQLQHAEQEDAKGSLGEEEKRRKIAQGSEYSMAGKFLPLQPSAARPR